MLSQFFLQYNVSFWLIVYFFPFFMNFLPIFVFRNKILLEFFCCIIKTTVRRLSSAGHVHGGECGKFPHSQEADFLSGGFCHETDFDRLSAFDCNDLCCPFVVIGLYIVFSGRRIAGAELFLPETPVLRERF